MSKRQRSVIASFVLTGMLIFANVVDDLQVRYWAIGGMTTLGVVMTIWSLKEVWQGISRVMTLLLPLELILGAGMFTFLLPDVVPGIGSWYWGTVWGLWIGWILRGLFWSAYAFAVYFLLLTENIFSVSAIRTIPLVRAASVAGYLLTLVSAFFLYYAAISFRLPYYYNVLFVILISAPLIMQSLWSVTLDEKISLTVWIATLVLTLAVAQLALVLSFWPMSVGVFAVLMTIWLYILLGICQHWLIRRLFVRTVWEYVGMGLFVCGVVGLYYWMFVLL